MKHELKLSNDGSYTIFLPEMNETYHSVHGAINESKHVFIEKGLKFFENPKELKVLEVGFGTGLNALLSYQFSVENNTPLVYHTLEPFPVPSEVVAQLNYANQLGDQAFFDQMHDCPWEQELEVDSFSMTKISSKLQDVELSQSFYDVIYFDAFAPNKQKEMWDLENLRKCFDVLKNGGILVTYCSQGQFKRDLKTAGFTLEMLDGPPGKREMTRGIKA